VTATIAAAACLPRAVSAAPARAYDGTVGEPSDETLARWAAGGDTRAFEQIVLRHQDRLYTLALRLTMSEADAHDCVQEALVSAWRSIGRFRGEARLSTWLYRIVVRKAYDAIEQRRRAPVPDAEPPARAVETSADERIDILAALARLEPEFRAAVVACDILGLSMDDAAEVLAVPTGTVKSRLSRARGRLAEQLLREEPA
jgi:RNA polymerase sigma-70 factor (ECF subfamily)